MECLKLDSEGQHGQVLEQTSIKLESMCDVHMSTDGLNSERTYSADQNMSRRVKVITTSQAPSQSSDSNVYSVFMPSQSIKVEPLFSPNEEVMPCCAAGPSVSDVEPQPIELCSQLLEEPIKQDDVSMLLLETGKRLTRNFLFHLYTVSCFCCVGVHLKLYFKTA
jgi:hypothetical protein